MNSIRILNNGGIALPPGGTFTLSDLPASLSPNAIQGTYVIPITGTVSVSVAATAVVGSGTLFTTELEVGGRISISNEIRSISAIADNTHLTLGAAHTAGASAVGAFPIGKSNVTVGDDGLVEINAEQTVVVFGVAGITLTTGASGPINISGSANYFGSSGEMQMLYGGGSTFLISGDSFDTGVLFDDTAKTALFTAANGASFTGKISVASTFELGHASDTTLSRLGAGRLGVEGVEVLTQTNTLTGITNKTFVAPVLGAATGTSLAIGGATLGGSALAVNGSATFSGTLAAASYGTTLGTNVGIYGPSAVYFGVGGPERAYIGAGGFYPVSDNNFDLGYVSLRFANIYGVNAILSGTTTLGGGTAIKNIRLRLNGGNLFLCGFDFGVFLRNQARLL
jgi:hypothetical protein